MMMGAGRMTTTAAPTLALQKPDEKRGSEVCVQTCDDARQL
jgi:hypothetical protein